MQKEMERELSFHPEIKLIVKDAELSPEKQIEQIQELIDEKVDLLIASSGGSKTSNTNYRTGVFQEYSRYSCRQEYYI